MAHAKPKTAPTRSVEDRLMNGDYDRMLEGFQAQIDDATATLRRAHAAMRAENTLRS